MKLFPRPKIFYVSPWLLAAATGLLVLIVVTFSLSNIQREKELMNQALLQKVTTLVRILHSGSKAAYFSDLSKGIWNPDPWTDYVQRIVNHVAEDPDVVIMTVIDASGKVVVHSSPDKIGTKLEIALPSLAGKRGSKEALVSYHRVNDSPSGKMFEAIGPFFPYRPFARPMPHFFLKRPSGKNHPEGNVLPRRFKQENLQDNEALRKQYYVIVGLDMRAYDQSLRRLRLQALILSLAMLLVGIGGWLSLAAVQGYRVSQRTLGDIRAFTALLVAKLPVGIIATDENGRITTINTAAAEMIGLEGRNVSGKYPDEVLPEDFSAFFKEPDTHFLAESDETGLEKEISATIAGRKQFFLCHTIAVRDNAGQYKGRVLLLSNLTQVKGLEKEMRENEGLAAVGRMAAGVAHEVRNPLSSIKGLALLLKNKFARDSREDETARLLIQEVERMNRTISELLSFARPPSLHLGKLALGDVLDENLRLIASDARSNNIHTRLEVADDLYPVLADRDRLNQVFINLLLNGIQSMDGGGELVVTAQNDPLKPAVIITVEDTGCGIEAENLSQLFYPYFTTKPGGTGIGLAISQKIVSDHKGAIRIESRPGRGTVVTVELPAYSAEAVSGT